MLMLQSAHALDIPGEPSSSGNTFFEAQAWQESDADLPPYPDEDRLLELSIDNANAFKYFIDPESVTVGADQVVRYIILLRSRTGSKNVFFEGVRCETNEYKSYAFATGKQLRRLRQSRWRLVSNSGAQRYRYELIAYFLCDNGSPLSHDTMMRRLRSEESGVHDASEIFL